MQRTRQAIEKLVGNMVHIEWLDSMLYGRWDTPNEGLKANLTCESCGFLVSVGDDRLVISASRHSYGEEEIEVAATQVIPLVAIVNVRRVK